MCGVFGWVSKDGGDMNMKRIQRIARNTMTRGAHAFGFAWIDSKDRLHCFKQAGRIADRLGILAMASDAKMLIGHCRYATHGDAGNNLNNHPHPADGGWIVHNGVVGNYESLLQWHDLNPNSECDSEILGLLIEQSEGSLLKRSIAAAKHTTGNLVMLGLWSKPQRLIAIRRGNPLSMGETNDGFYLASLDDELTGKVSQFKDGEGVELG